jgi:uncharacterized membrane protein YbaN (DUF454 family)
VAVGVLGIFLPLLPTTPFFLLAAACYARSSRRFYSWFLDNKWFGTYIRDYREGRGVPMKVKALIVSLLWIAIGSSAVFAVHIALVRIILVLIAIAVTVHILSIRTVSQPKLGQ